MLVFPWRCSVLTLASWPRSLRADGGSRCFQISAANVLLGVAICSCNSQRSCAGDGLLAPASARLLLGAIMCAGSGRPTGVHEFVLYRHSSLSQSRHREGRAPRRDGVDFRGRLFIAEEGTLGCQSGVFLLRLQFFFFLLGIQDGGLVV